MWRLSGYELCLSHLDRTIKTQLRLQCWDSTTYLLFLKIKNYTRHLQVEDSTEIPIKNVGKTEIQVGIELAVKSISEVKSQKNPEVKRQWLTFAFCMTWEGRIVIKWMWKDEIAEQEITCRNKEGKDHKRLPQQRKKRNKTLKNNLMKNEENCEESKMSPKLQT